MADLKLSLGTGARARANRIAQSGFQSKMERSSTGGGGGSAERRILASRCNYEICFPWCPSAGRTWTCSQRH
eukprot:3929271-Pyramimonas_sp.AAC.1